MSNGWMRVVFLGLVTHLSAAGCGGGSSEPPDSGLTPDGSATPDSSVTVDGSATPDSGVAVDGSATADSSSDGSSWTRISGAVTTTDVHVASSAGGATGISVRLMYPALSTGARYAAGVPVVLQMSGGHSSGSHENPHFAELGFLSATYLYPGGSSQGKNSGGNYDYRGPNCHRASADVLRFLTGQVSATVDSDGSTKSLTQIVGYSVLTNNVGVLGSSNGGNMAAMTFALHGSELSGTAWFVGWENPTGDQMVTVELGGAAQSNPGYTLQSCTLSGCTLNYANLKLAATAAASVDDPATPAPDPIPLPGVVYWDSNGNNQRDSSEFSPSPLGGRLGTGSLVAFFSTELTQAMADRGLISGSFATVQQATDYWSARDPLYGSGKYMQATQKMPSLRVMVLASSTDHVQGSPDHPHIKLQLDAWRMAGAAWIRYNPDSAYLTQLGAAQPHTESTANSTYSWGDVSASLVADQNETMGKLTGAAIEEMADRTQAGNWTNNLVSTLAQ